MPDIIHDESGARSTVPDTYDAGFILEEAGNPNHSGWQDNGDGTKTIVYHPNDHLAVIAVIDDYAGRHLAKEAKPSRWAEVKAIRDAKEAAAAQTPLGPVDSDDKSKIKILGLVAMAQLALNDEKQLAAAENRAFDPTKVAFNEEFTMADNTVVQLDAFEAITMARAAGAHVSAIHANARAMRKAIEGAVDATALDAIDVTLGWPA